MPVRHWVELLDEALRRIGAEVSEPATPAITISEAATKAFGKIKEMMVRRTV